MFSLFLPTLAQVHRILITKCSRPKPLIFFLSAFLLWVQPALAVNVLVYYHDDSGGLGTDLDRIGSALTFYGYTVTTINVAGSGYNPGPTASTGDNWSNYAQVWDCRFDDADAGSSCPAPLAADNFDANWQSTAAAGLTYTRGNSDILLFTAKIQSQKKDLLNEWLLEADATYGENDSVNNADSLHGSAQYNRIFSDRFYGFDNADALHDGIQNLKYRASMSPGAGYYFIKDKSSDLVGEIGPSGVAEDRGDETDYFLSLRVAEHFDQKLSDSAKLWEKAEFIPEVNKPANYIMNVEVGMETAITRKISLQLTLDDAYVNRPAAGRTDNDVKLVSGIAYKF